MLYLPVACPGSGKSYVAEQMVKAEIIKEDAVVSPDRYREILTGDRANQEVNGQVFKIVDSIVDERISRGLDVYLDATNLNEKLRKKLLERLTKLSFDFTLPLTVLVSDASYELLSERNIGRPWPVPDHVFERFWNLQQNLSLEALRDRYGAEIVTFDEMLARISSSHKDLKIL